MDDFDEAIRIKHGSEWPTDREFEAYFIIINTLRKTMPINDISYKRNDEYISLIYKNNPSKCICKLYLNEPQNYVLIPTDGITEERIDIANIYELAKKKKYFIKSLKRYLNPLFNANINSK